MSGWKLELWPGYVTSIRQHESQLLMCCEPKFKVVRTDTVLDQMRDIMRRWVVKMICCVKSASHNSSF